MCICIYVDTQDAMSQISLGDARPECDGERFPQPRGVLG